MKQFFKYISVLTIMVIVLMAILDIAYSYVFRTSEPRSKIQKILQVSNVNYDYVFLGSSRTENHIDCEIITKITGKSCVNFGISGGSIGDMLVLLKLMDSKGLTFDKLFLQMDYNYNHSGLSANFRARLMPFINEPAVKNKLEMVGMNKAEEMMPFYRFMKNDQVIGFREFIASILNKKPTTGLNVGFAPKKGIGDLVASPLPMEIYNENNEVNMLEELVTARGKDIQFFTAPFCSKKQQITHFMSLLKERMPGLWDYSNLYEDRNEFFYNCGHLNIEGARDFSNIIANRELLNTNQI